MIHEKAGTDSDRRHGTQQLDADICLDVMLCARVASHKYIKSTRLFTRSKKDSER